MAKIILVTGGARSGKSAFAEKLALSSGERVGYIATAEVRDPEMSHRVELHRKRRPGDWVTYEAPAGAEAVVAEAAGVAGFLLFDCLTIYTSNQLLSFPEGEGFGRRTEVILKNTERLIGAAQSFPGTVVFVTNEVGDGIVPENRLAREFRDIAGLVNQRVAEAAEEVYWVVCGLPVEVKKPALHITGGRH